MNNHGDRELWKGLERPLMSPPLPRELWIGQLSYQFSKYLVAVPKERLPIPKGDPKPVKRKGLCAGFRSTETSNNSLISIGQFVSETLMKNPEISEYIK